MASIAQPQLSLWRGLAGQVTGWIQENVTNSLYSLAAHVALVWITVVVFRAQLESDPLIALGIAALWVVGLALVIASAVIHRYNVVSQWLKDRLFNSAINAMITLIISLLIVGLFRQIVAWAIFNANFSADPVAAAASDHAGATWGIVAANIKLFMVGQFESGQLWRVWACFGLLAALTVVSIPVYGLFSRELKPVRRWVTWAWIVSPPIFYLLLRGLGDSGPVPTIETRTWGGLLFTLIVSVFAIVVSFPLGVLLALGRRSAFQGIPAWLTYGVVGIVTVGGFVTYTLPNIPLARGWLEYALILWPIWLGLAGVAFQQIYKGNVVAAFCTIYIEFVRGVPLITVLFMAQLMLPLFLPSDIHIENAFRAIWGFTFFSAAYLAENVRGGLQSIPKGQYEAAEALGLHTFQQLRLVILPQALRVVIPPIIGQFIGLFKDTSLVAIVGLFDLLNIANSVIAQPDWLGLRREAYVFISLVYYAGCFVMATAGNWLEKRVGLGER